MTRFTAATTILTVLIGSFAFAQDSTPKVQVFGGYSLVHEDTGGLSLLTVDMVVPHSMGSFGVKTAETMVFAANRAEIHWEKTKAHATTSRLIVAVVALDMVPLGMVLSTSNPIGRFCWLRAFLETSLTREGNEHLKFQMF
jgi:hypothetical protein